MDIEYLLKLQEFRVYISDALTPFMDFISTFAVNYLILFPVIIYWIMDKKKGLYILSSACTSICFGATTKLTACVYRPWIKDPAIIPAGDALTESTGYSFPSGHTTTSSPIYGGMALSYGKGKKWWFAVICWALLAITMFSRNYLGVHTPQDVIVGFGLSCLVLFAMHHVFKYLEKKPDKEWVFLVLGMAVAIAALLFITFKSYPMDYVDGKLLVDPEKMKVDGYKDISMLLAFCIGRFIEKKFINFSSTGFKVKGVIVSVLGLVPLIFIVKILPKLITDIVGETLSKTLGQFLMVLFIVAGWPAVLKLVSGRRMKAETK